METIDRTAKERRAELSYLAHDASRIVASYQGIPRLRDTLIRALCSRFSVGVRRHAEG